MPTLNLDLDVFTNPKVVRFAGILGPGSEVHWIRLLCYIGKHRPGTGGFDDWSAEEVESAADWRGEKGRMAEALVRSGLFHQKETGYFAHDWRDHQPHLVQYAKTRRERRKAALKSHEKRKNGRKAKDGEGMEDSAKRDFAGAKKDAKRSFACPNFEFCTGSAVQCSNRSKDLLSPARIAEAAERLVARYAEKVKPKKLDNSGSKTRFIATAKSILERGTHEECLTRAIDNYASSRAETEESDDEVKFRFGFQTFFGPANQHWKDFVIATNDAKGSKSADALNAEMMECENRVAGKASWNPGDVIEEILNESG